MENLSHSRSLNRGSTSVSKKSCNGNSGSGAFVAQTIYDDVYGGPPKFGVSALSPRFEDYGEIFGSFHALRASSIPILDLPAVDETEVFFDARSSAFDYAEVFGGFDGLDFAVPYEELINSSKGVDDGSSDEAWTPAGTESLSDCSDHSGKSHCKSNGDSNQTCGGSTEFCVSYNKVNRESNGDVSNGKIHVTQLQVLPGFSYLVDEANPSGRGKDDDSLLPGTDDSYLNIDFNTGKVKDKHPRNIMPPPLDSNGNGKSFENFLTFHNRYGRDVCSSYEDFITVSEISLRTEPSKVPPPSRPPPMFIVKRGNSTSNCRVAASESEVILDDHSLPSFDVEVDASSSAAVSAAAMKEAMEKAQARLQSAKDLWERKKEGVHGRVKLDPKNDMKEKEGNLTQIPNQFKSLTNEIPDHEIKVPAREKRQKVVKATEVCSVPYGGEELLTVAEKTVEDRHGCGFFISEKHDCYSEWKEATEFFELARTDISGKEFEPVNNDNISNFVHGQVEAESVTKTLENGENVDDKVKPFVKDHVLQDEVTNMGNVIHGKDEDNIKLKPNKHETWLREQVKFKIHQRVYDLSENDKKSGLTLEFVDAKMQQYGAGNLEKHERPMEYKQRENQVEAELPVSPEDMEQKKIKVAKRTESKSIPKKSHMVENNGNKMEEAIEIEENDKLLREAFERENFEQRTRMVLEQQEKEKRLNLVLEEEENLKEHKASERQLEGIPEEDDYGGSGKEADRVGVSERFKLAGEREDDNIWSKDLQGREECETGVDDSFQQVDIEGMLRHAGKSEETETMAKDSHDRAELRSISTGHDDTEKLKDTWRVNPTVGTQSYVQVEDFRISAGACQMADNKNHLVTKLACDHIEKMGMFQELPVLDESGERKNIFNGSECSSESGGIEILQFVESSSASSVCETGVEHHKFSVNMEDASIPLALNEWTRKASEKRSFDDKDCEAQTYTINMENGLLSESTTSMANGEIEIEKLKMKDKKKPLPTFGSDEKAGQTDIGMEQVPVGRMKSVTRMDSDPELQEKKLFCSMEDRGKLFNLVDGKEQKVSVPGGELRPEKGRETETTQPTISERMQKSGESSREVNENQGTERKGKVVNQSHASKARENQRVRSETELENEILRKLEEEREREREREKDRMPVDRISLEPRDKVTVESRERAERAALERLTSEARQRTLAEARERLEKACAEARENSLAGKATMEARVRAERAAVERATAEARERAAEKAISDRTPFGVRERIERSVSDKFSASSINNEMRHKSSFSGQPNLQSQSFGSSIASRCNYYSVYDERTEGVDGESPQRCKARLERHKRTAERAAKALAEKNMRDLLAQREQAERNRLAETLDADVRRWLSGKEGNLRALLSTLQYILGPDSGWQPIPLTEVITAAAVKRAYRKATLCVHPDKLQQRGASIQQKYICEKVFDLLKEAWNKFNSEER